MKPKELLEEIEREDNLPSVSGWMFRDILNYQEAGWRERDILTNWLRKYLDMTQNEREEITDYLDSL